MRLIEKHRALATDDQLAFFGPRQFAAVTALVNAKGDVVSFDRLISLVWCDGVLPTNPAARLRNIIKDIQTQIKRFGVDVVPAWPAGYQLVPNKTSKNEWRNNADRRSQPRLSTVFKPVSLRTTVS